MIILSFIDTLSDFYDVYGGLLLLGAAVVIMIVGLIAQAKVKSTFSKYSEVPASSGMTAANIAEELLSSNGSTVNVAQIPGTLTDNYNPKTGSVSLSEAVYSSTSVAAIAVAAHECGHVMQYEQGYRPIHIRNTILPVASFGSKYSYLLVFIGILISYLLQWMGTIGYYISIAGVALFAFALAFQLITLPVELNASKRALDMLTAGGYITGAEEEAAAKKVLRAAAMTYVVAALAAAVSFLRLLWILRSGRRR